MMAPVLQLFQISFGKSINKIENLPLILYLLCESFAGSIFVVQLASSFKLTLQLIVNNQTVHTSRKLDNLTPPYTILISRKCRTDNTLK